MSVLFDSYVTSNYNGSSLDAYTGSNKVAQTFTPSTTGAISKSSIYLSRAGTLAGSTFCKIYNITGTYGSTSSPTGSALASASIAASTIPAMSSPAAFDNHALVDFIFTGADQIILTSGSHYAITIEYSSGDGTNTFIDWGADNSSPTHGGNASWFNGTSWTTQSGMDMVFYVYGEITPVASFTKNTALINKNDAVTFTDTSTNTPTSWAWDFGDGNTSTSQSPTHTYSAAGTFTVGLTATNAGGSNSASSSVTVVNPRTLSGLSSISNISSLTL